MDLMMVSRGDSRSLSSRQRQQTTASTQPSATAAAVPHRMRSRLASTIRQKEPVSTSCPSLASTDKGVGSSRLLPVS